MTAALPSPAARAGAPARTGASGGAGILTAIGSIPIRRRLQVALGLLWLVDAALQFQPFMFGRDFVTQIIEPAVTGTPYVVSHPALWAAHLMIRHIGTYNWFFALTQLLIAAAILYRPLARIGLAVSVVWALAVWWLGEGIGGITLGMSPVMGAPGAAVIYALIAVLVWPRPDPDPARGASVAGSSPLGTVVPRVIWSGLWLGFIALGLEAVNRSPSALYGMVTGMSYGEPGWIRSMDRTLGGPLAHHGTEWSIVLAGLYAFAAAGVWVPRLVKPALAIAIVLGVAIWLAEDFGGVFTGSGTDVNSGPLLVLLAATLWPMSGSRLEDGSSVAPA